MKRVLVRGPLLTMSGYGTHSRQIFKWLESEGFEIVSQVTPWGITPWYVNPDYLDGLVGRIMQTAAPIQNPAFDASFQIQLPNEWDPNIAKYNVGITAAVETDRCNPAWIQSCNQMNHVVVPSNHTKSTLERSGKIDTQLDVIPESFYDCLLDETNEKNLNLQFATEFNFLVFGQITGQNPFTDRKNTFFALKWLCEEFKNNSDVGIVIKTNCGTNSTKDRRMTSLMLDKLINEVREGPYPRLYMLHGASRAPRDSEHIPTPKNQGFSFTN